MGIKKKIKKHSETDEGISLRVAFEKYIAEKDIAQGLSPATIDSYWGSFNRFIGYYEENKDVNSVDLDVLYGWIGTMRNDGIKHTSINHYLRAIRTFLYWSMDRGFIENPYKISLLKGQNEPLKTYSVDEQKALIERPRKNAQFTEIRTWVIANFVLDSGSRLSTIINIKMQDVNLDGREIIQMHTKNKKAQMIPISSAFANILNQYIREWRKDAEESEYLFCNIGGEQLTPSALKLSYRRYCKNRGIEKTSIHGLRHSFATGYIKNNGNTFALQKILGHATLDMTRKYVSLVADDVKADHDSRSPLGNLTKGKSRKNNMKKTG